MKAILFVICGFFLANIVTATFIWPPKTTASDTPEPIVNAATRQGQDPWMVNERYNAPNRDRTRKERWIVSINPGPVTAPPRATRL